jgi:hypothetical protein
MARRRYRLWEMTAWSKDHVTAVGYFITLTWD